MATGLITLAYMAELAVVFNLAYAELKSGRYIRQTSRDILNWVSTFDDVLANQIREKLKQTQHSFEDGQDDPFGNLGEKISQLRAGDKIIHIRQQDFLSMSELYSRLDHVFSSSRLARSGAWTCGWSKRMTWMHGINEARTFWLSAKYSYWIFNWRHDKKIAYIALVVAAVLLVLITLIENGSTQPAAFARNASAHVPWLETWTKEDCFTFFFWILLIAMTLPGIFIGLGILMRRALRLIFADLQASFDKIRQQQIETQINSSMANPKTAASDR